MNETEQKIQEYLSDMHKYEFLWTKDLAQELEAFIAESPPENLNDVVGDGEPLSTVLELIDVDLGRTVRVKCFFIRTSQTLSKYQMRS